MTRPELDNIKVFNYYVLKILTKLYDKFPEPVEINGVRFLVKTVVDKGSGAIEAKYYYLFPHTMSWLREEGFIKFDPGSAIDHYKNATLTLRGLTVLGYLPQSLGAGRKKTIIEQAKDAISRGITDAGSEAIKMLVTNALKLMLQQHGI